MDNLTPTMSGSSTGAVFDNATCTNCTFCAACAACATSPIAVEGLVGTFGLANVSVIENFFKDLFD